jgi:hypothetical protein
MLSDAGWTAGRPLVKVEDKMRYVEGGCTRLQASRWTKGERDTWGREEGTKSEWRQRCVSLSEPLVTAQRLSSSAYIAVLLLAVPTISALINLAGLMSWISYGLIFLIL